MVKAPVKKKQKKIVKQKQKQNVNVKQNVKVVVGEIKKRRAVKSSGAKAGASSKPPIVLNISNPQPYNNMFMEYFKKQLQNQEAIKANTLNQQVKLNEQEERKASKAGALHSLDQEPDDVARELSRLKIESVERIRQADAERKEQNKEMQGSIRKLPKPTGAGGIRALQTQQTPIYNPEQQLDRETEMLKYLEQQRSETEREIEKGGAGAGANDEDEDEDEEDETQTVTEQWSQSDESFIEESESLYRKPRDELYKTLNEKTIKQLRNIASTNKVPYAKNNRQLKKADLINNLIIHFNTGTPQARPGRPPK